MFYEMNKLISDIDSIFSKGIIKNRVSKIRIKKFRNFINDSELTFTFPLTVFVGKNGTGKTTVLKAIKMLSKTSYPQNEFFETAIDNGGFENAEIEFLTDTSTVTFKRIRENEWEVKGELPDTLNIMYIQTKSMIGATDKGLFYDDTGKSTARIKKVEYIIKQTKKIMQNSKCNSERKLRHYLNDNAVCDVNYILQSNYKTIEIVKHKYFSGTWGTSIIFEGNKKYSEYNAGSGEFVVVQMVDRISVLPSGSILLLDEPEVSLHPGAQKRLMCFILDTIKKNKIQVIVTTQSPSLINQLPKNAIKCFRNINSDKILIEEQVFFKNAFIDLETDFVKKHIVVEDDLAKQIIDKVLEVEKLSDLVKVNFYPGGATSIKKHLLPAYSKTKILNSFFILDGDQFFEEVPDFAKIPEIDKDLTFYKNLFKKVTNIKPDKIEWGINANRKAGRYNEQQEKELFMQYLEYFKHNVIFLPQKIPEDIIYDKNKLESILGLDGFPDVNGIVDSKQKLKAISDSTGQALDQLEYQLIYWFAKNKQTDYQNIVKILKDIIERGD